METALAFTLRMCGATRPWKLLWPLPCACVEPQDHGDCFGLDLAAVWSHKTMETALAFTFPFLEPQDHGDCFGLDLAAVWSHKTMETALALTLRLCGATRPWRLFWP